MSLEDELLDIMSDRVTIAPFASSSGAGAVQYGPARPWRASIQPRLRPAVVVDRSGRDVTSTVRVMLAPASEDGIATSIGYNDQLTLPAGYNPAQPPIIGIARRNDVDGSIHHWEVSL